MAGLRTTMAFAAMAAMLAATPSLADNRTVVFTVPVDISAMPYVQSFTVECRLTYLSSAVLTPDINAASLNRVDHPLVRGEFHGTVAVKITAAPGPAPSGYTCGLGVTPKDGTGGFTPLAPNSGSLETPAEHLAAPGTVPVTMVKGVFAAQLLLGRQPYRPLTP